MSNSQHSEFQDDPQFQAILAQCLEKLERGESLDREAIERQHPQYARELRDFLDDHDLLRQMATAGQAEIVVAPTLASGQAYNGFGLGDAIQYIGEYRILKEIARGGMGVVFKAKQRDLKRIVALKMILAGRLANEADVQRFHREAQAAARLKHPNIVPVHEVGEHEGHHYFAMDFIEGQSLAEVLRDEALSPDRAAAIIKTVAKAVNYAHQQGTLHRDLKPANVILDSQDQPHITDFGLAKFAEDEIDGSSNDLTATGQVLGTPSYMSPEQASGKPNLVGPASDIYSLGAVLYACLTGRAPFVADSQVDTLLQVMRNDPVAPRMLNPSIPKDLENICLKCLAKEPYRRYGTAEEFASDLDRYLRGHPVIARPVGRITKTVRWCGRNPAAATLLAVVGFCLIAGTSISSYFAYEAKQQANAALAETKAKEEQRKIAVQATADAEAARSSEESGAFRSGSRAARYGLASVSGETVPHARCLGETGVWPPRSTVGGFHSSR